MLFMRTGVPTTSGQFIDVKNGFLRLCNTATPHVLHLNVYFLVSLTLLPPFAQTQNTHAYHPYDCYNLKNERNSSNIFHLKIKEFNSFL